MLLCEETASVLHMLRPKAKLVEDACQCKSAKLSKLLCKHSSGDFMSFLWRIDYTVVYYSWNGRCFVLVTKDAISMSQLFLIYKPIKINYDC